MKSNNILRISVLPLVLFAVIAFTNVQPGKNNDQKEKENKSQGQPASKGKNQDSKGNNNNSSKGNDNRDNKGNNQAKGMDHGKSDAGKDHNAGRGNNSNGNSKVMNGKRDMDINWGLENFANRKHPKNQKKVTICHNPSDDNSNGVSINISENALQAHMNHGDKMGDCNIDYSDRWSSNYVKSRENVYNTYEQAWETMSYSEALLKLGVEKLLGIRTNLDRNRTTLTSNEIQRREALILDLQNNVISLENQLNSSRQRLDSDVSIMVNL